MEQRGDFNRHLLKYHSVKVNLDQNNRSLYFCISHYIRNKAKPGGPAHILDVESQMRTELL
jgi:hypothetical protein